MKLEDVEILSEDIPGWSVASDNGLTVALDITITDDLKKEGIARELVNRVQNMRKDMGFEVQDKIVIKTGSGDDFVQMALKEYQAYICRETQANALDIVDQLNEGQEIELNDFKVSVSIKKQI